MTCATPAARGGSAGVGKVAGRVLDSNGVPMAGATVAVVASAGRHRDVAALSAADGSFWLGGLPAGEAVIEARGAGTSGRAEVAVVAEATAQVEVTLD